MSRSFAILVQVRATHSFFPRSTNHICRWYARQGRCIVAPTIFIRDGLLLASTADDLDEEKAKVSALDHGCAPPRAKDVLSTFTTSPK